MINYLNINIFYYFLLFLPYCIEGKNIISAYNSLYMKVTGRFSILYWKTHRPSSSDSNFFINLCYSASINYVFQLFS